MKLHFFPCLWIHNASINFFVVFNWKLKSCRDSLVAGFGSWEVGNDIQPVCSSGKCFHSNLGLPRTVTCFYGELFLTYTFVRKQTHFSSKPAFLAHLFCLCQSMVNCKEGFWVQGKPFSPLGQSRCGTGAQKNSVLFLWGFSSPDWINLPGLSSELSRMWSWRPPKAPSHLSYSGLL